MTAPRYFFVHVMKTGGNSVKRALFDQFGRHGVYPAPGDAIDRFTAGLDVDNLRRTLDDRGDEIEVVVGHFPLCVREILGEPVTLTVLRDPVERTVSYLRDQQRRPNNAGRTPEEIYADRFYFDTLIHNHMTRMFSLDLDEMTDGALTVVAYDDERLARARRRLATVDVIGLQRDLGAFQQELDERFGWRLGEVRWLRRSPQIDVDSELLERIERDNAADVELYRYAEQLVAERRAHASR